MLADMNTRLPGFSTGRLERLCGCASGDVGGDGGRIRIGSGAEGIERLEAHFVGQAFSPHRHDTYAIGVTLSGVQTFRYRGGQRHCLPGQCHILHPDETHDGGSGTEDGFGYRIIYIDPWLIQEAIGGKPLPFVQCPVVDVARLPKGFVSTAWNIDEEIDDIVRIEIAVMAADMLFAVVPDCMMKPRSLAIDALSRVRDLIAAHPAGRHSMDELERLSDLDRWTLARQFRAAFGTSPSRFRTMRQLDHVRRLLKCGTTLAEASIEAGFADQSHMSRRFKSAYGITAGRWVSATV
jgi:AraC-like DNA-binding protein